MPIFFDGSSSDTLKDRILAWKSEKYAEENSWSKTKTTFQFLHTSFSNWLRFSVRIFKNDLWSEKPFVFEKNQKKLWQISSLRERSGKRRGSTSFGFLLAAAYLLHIELALKNRDLVTVIIFTLVSNKKVIALLTSKHCAPAWKMIIV